MRFHITSMDEDWIRRYMEAIGQVRDSMSWAQFVNKFKRGLVIWEHPDWDDVFEQEFEGAVRSFLHWIPEGADQWLRCHSHFFHDPDDVLHARGFRDIPMVRSVDFPRGSERFIHLDAKRLREMIEAAWPTWVESD